MEEEENYQNKLTITDIQKIELIKEEFIEIQNGNIDPELYIDQGFYFLLNDLQEKCTYISIRNNNEDIKKEAEQLKKSIAETMISMEKVEKYIEETQEKVGNLLWLKKMVKMIENGKK